MEMRYNLYLQILFFMAWGRKHTHIHNIYTYTYVVYILDVKSLGERVRGHEASWKMVASHW